MKTVILIVLSAVSALATSLTGTLNGPNGVGVNGTLTLSLAQQASLMSTGGCGGPIEVVPTYQVRIPVVNGAMTGSPSVYGNDCLQPGGTYYNVLVQDSGGNTLFTDNWQITGTTLNIGTIVSLVITGTTQTLGSTGFVSLIPTITQQVNQPFGTYLGVNYLAVTGTLTLPGGNQCTPVGCNIFGGTIAAGNITLSGYAISPIFNANVIGLGSGAKTFQNSDGSFTIDYHGNIAGQTLTVDGLTVLGTLGGSIISPIFNGLVTGGTCAPICNKTFQNSDGSFTIDYLGNAAFQTVDENVLYFAGQGAPPPLSTTGNLHMYYDNVNDQLWSSFGGGAWTGLRSPVFNGVVTGGSCSGGPPVCTKTFQNSDGSFTIDYAGNLAAQTVTANSITSLGSVNSNSATMLISIISPIFNANVTGLSSGAKTFQNSNGNFTIDYLGNIASQTVTANQASFVASIISPIFNANVTGLSSGAKTFQNSNGNFTIDYLGNIASQTVTANQASFVALPTSPGGYSPVCINTATGALAIGPC